MRFSSTPRNVTVAMLLALSTANCKTVQQSEAKNGTNATPTVLQANVGGYTNMDWKSGDLELVELNSTQAGLINITVTVAYNVPAANNQRQNLAKIPHVKVYESGNPNTALVEGDLFPYPNYAGYYQGQITVNGAVGKYVVEIDQFGQMTGGGKGQGTVQSQYMVTQAAASNVIGQNGYNSSFSYNKQPLPLKLQITRKGPMNVSMSAQITKISNQVQNPNNQAKSCGCSMSVKLTENGKDFVSTVNENGGYLNGSVGYDLSGGDYPYEIDFKGVDAGSVIQLNVYQQPVTGSNGQPLGAVGVLGLLQLGFDQNNNKTGRVGGQDFGFKLEPDRKSEAKIDATFNVIRLVNRVAPGLTLPQAVTLNLMGPNSNTLVSSSPVKLQNNSYFQGSVFVELDQADYKLLADKQGFDDNDIIVAGGNMSVSNLTLPDGGEPLSNFTDPSPVTTTPPMDYNADTSVPAGQVYTPATKPVDMAMKSVLEAMELTRNTWHLRVPKGVKRGATNAIDASTIEACLGNVAAHWSDIIIHYYCQHGQARACYTPKAPQLGRKGAYDDCAKNDANFKWVAQTQGDVFQYVMFSQTYAFDMEQQQRVLNAFYRVTNPKDKTECLAKRPRRAIDPTDGTHCLANKIMNQPMQGIGR